MRPRRGKSLHDDRPFSCPSKEGRKEPEKLHKLWSGEAGESDEGWWSSSTGQGSSVTREAIRSSETSLSSGLGEEEWLQGLSEPANQHYNNSEHGFTDRNPAFCDYQSISCYSTLSSDHSPHSKDEESAPSTGSPSPEPPDPQCPGQVSRYIAFFLRRNLSHGERWNHRLRPEDGRKAGGSPDSCSSRPLTYHYCPDKLLKSTKSNFQKRRYS